MAQNNIAVILVEGDSDLLLISLLLEKWLNFKFVKKGPFMPDCDNYSWYGNDQYRLLMLNAGGFNKFSEKYKYIKQQVHENDSVTKFIIITDADNKTDEEIINNINFDKEISFSKDELKKLKLNYALGEKELETFLKVIPVGKQGALETVVIDSIACQEPSIVQETTRFVDSLSNESKKYITKRRYELKSKMAIICTLMDPLNAFCELKKRFVSVDINNDVIQENFGFLREIFK